MSCSDSSNAPRLQQVAAQALISSQQTRDIFHAIKGEYQREDRAGYEAAAQEARTMLAEAAYAYKEAEQTRVSPPGRLEAARLAVAQARRTRAEGGVQCGQCSRFIKPISDASGSSGCPYCRRLSKEKQSHLWAASQYRVALDDIDQYIEEANRPYLTTDREKNYRLENARRSLEVGQEYHERGEYGFAVECYNRSLKTAPSPQAYLGRAESYSMQQNWEGAIADYANVRRQIASAQAQTQAATPTTATAGWSATDKERVVLGEARAMLMAARQAERQAQDLFGASRSQEAVARLNHMVERDKQARVRFEAAHTDPLHERIAQSYRVKLGLTNPAVAVGGNGAQSGAEAGQSSQPARLPASAMAAALPALPAPDLMRHLTFSTVSPHTRPEPSPTKIAT